MLNMAVVGTKDVHQYLSSKQNEADPSAAEEWAKLEELYNKKLWHQLTLRLEIFIKHPSLEKGDSRIQLYNNFIQIFESKINPLSLVEIVACVVPQFSDPKDALEFLKKTEVKVKGNSEAIALCKVLGGQIMLKNLADKEETKGVFKRLSEEAIERCKVEIQILKKVIEEVEKLLDDVDGITPVHGRYYLLASDLYRMLGDFAEYYRTALRYLGCIDISELSNKVQQDHAYCLGLAALLGEGVYNFGELLAHPILETLKTSDERGWLVKFLYAFNSGSIKEFNNMRAQWTAVPDLKDKELALRQKISLLCLMEMTFKRPATSRQLTFQEIAKETQLPINEIELLVMKALAQGLVKGAIDQVASTVLMTWVQPRVLNKDQISTMIQRLDMWCTDVQSMEMLLETKAHDFLTF